MNQGKDEILPTTDNARAAAEDRVTTDSTPAGSTSVERIPAPPVGNFGHYQLQRLIGQGGMGEVYLARDTTLGRIVALKMPKLSKSSPVQRERFLREAKAAAALAHPSICRVYDVGEVEGRPYLTMAYVEGESLGQALRARGPWEPREAARLVIAVARAMQHAHDHGILHRDLKPGNIQIDAQGHPVVMDFGLAFWLDTPTRERLTQQGLVVGTPVYMSPEQINNQDLGPAADVYSLGVVLYELLAGQPPFEGSFGQLVAQIETQAPPPPSDYRPGLDRSVEAICLKALAKRPEERWLDMTAFALALENFLHGKPVFDDDAETLEQPLPRRRGRWRRWSWLVVAGAILAILIASVLFWLWYRTTANTTPTDNGSLAPAARESIASASKPPNPS
jgi:serine/threonine-protein kinase